MCCAFALIGGSGFGRLANLEVIDSKQVQTPYGSPSAAILIGRLHDRNILFLARHGQEHSIPPHRINYRANIWALKHLGARQVLGIAAVGGITKRCGPGSLVVPDQIIDYTWGRDQTFHDDADTKVSHIDFTQPYCDELRTLVVNTCNSIGVSVVDTACYAATQGPRFETAAEVNKLENDGADVVGMTGMPEASLAREAGICYATLAIVVNPGAGRGTETIAQSDIQEIISQATKTIQRVLAVLLPTAGKLKFDTPKPIQP